MKTSLLLLIAVSVSLAVAASSQQSSKPEPNILHLAHTIWYPIQKKPRQQALVRTLKEQIRQAGWQNAIKTAEKLSLLLPKSRPDYEWDQPWGWRAAIAELYLYNAEPEKAISELNTIFAEVPAAKGERRGGSFARQDAAYAMARAEAERGDFASAITWLKKAPDEYWSGCGNCMEGEQVRAHPILAVWGKAQLSYDQAVPALEAILAGRYTPMKTSLWPAKDSAKVQKKHAREEAALILGELHLRQGKTEKAVVSFTIASKSEYDLALIARTRLKSLLPLDRNNRRE